MRIKDDPTDDKYIACALEAGARYIVSGDEHLTRLRDYQGIDIVTPAFFIESVLAQTGPLDAEGGSHEA